MNPPENPPHRDDCPSHRSGMWCNCDRRWDERDDDAHELHPSAAQSGQRSDDA